MKKHHHHHSTHCGHPHCGDPHCGKSHCGCPPTNCGKFFCYCWVVYFFENIIGSITEFYYRITAKDSKKYGNYIKVAFIGNYNANCGISTYNEDLIDGLISPQRSNDAVIFHVFAEYMDGSKEERVDGDERFVTRCWSRSDHPKSALIQNISEFKPDIVHISHEYGLFPEAYKFTSLVSVLKSMGIQVVATMHSVYDHKDKTVSENAPDFLIVHTQEAKNCLISKGIVGDKITVIPHGTPVQYKDGTALLPAEWNTWNSNHTIFHAGFLFGYKGHLRMLNVISRLKNDYPDIHYIIQGSENTRNQAEHDRVYADIMAVAKKLDIEGNITVNRGFVSSDVLLSHIRTVKCCVLPYVTHPDHDVRATSGIARLILTTETPLIVSDVHLFDDIKPVVDYVAHNDEELYQLIKKVFSEDKLSDDQKNKRLTFLQKTSWSNVSAETLSLYRKIND